MYKLLLADDEAQVRERLARSLSKMDIPIEVVGAAGDGQEALNLAKTEKPDILITDIAMPIVNGLEVIRRLREQGIQTKNIIISGYDEFDYARTAITLGVTDYLLKPFLPGEMRDVLVKIIQELDNRKVFDRNLENLVKQADRKRFLDREQAFRNILQGDFSKEAVTCLGYPDDEKADSLYQCCLLSLNGTLWNFHVSDTFAKFMEELTSGYFGRGLGFSAAGLDPQKVMVCFYAKALPENAFRDAVNTGLRRFTASFQKYYDVLIYCTLGRIVRDVREISQSARDALNTWKRTLVPDTQIRMFERDSDVAQTTAFDVKAEIRRTKELMRASVISGRAEETQRLLENLIQLYSRLPDRGTDYIFISAQDMVLQIGDDLVEKGCPRLDGEIMEWLSERSYVAGLAELQRRLREFLVACCEEAQEAADAQKAQTCVRLARAYMDEHLADAGLSVEQVAEYVRFSPSYLRQIFKEQTGENLGEYIIRSRMERAEDYLLHSSMKISEVAERCGYDNQRYFASSFRKYFGCTPTDYKERRANRADTDSREEVQL